MEPDLPVVAVEVAPGLEGVCRRAVVDVVLGDGEAVDLELECAGHDLMDFRKGVLHGHRLDLI